MSTWIVRGTIWIALAVFAAAEGGRWWARRRQRPVWWAPVALLLAVFAMAAHFVATMYFHHGWSHARAWEFTAEQTARVYGVSWGGGLWINYLFLAAWVAEAAWWWRHPHHVLAPPSAARWALRTFYAIIIVNAAVVFTSGAARVAGALLTAILLRFWIPEPPAVPHRRPAN